MVDLLLPLNRTLVWTGLILTTLLALGSGGCSSPRSTDNFCIFHSGSGFYRRSDITTITPVENLPEVFARVLVVDGNFSGYPELFIIYSQVVDERDLWFGVSRKRDEMYQCWFYQDKVLSLCTEADLERAFYLQEGIPPVPRIFFAIATLNEREALIILDFIHDRSALDPVDGYRVVLQPVGNTWQVKSWAQVY